MSQKGHFAQTARLAVALAVFACAAGCGASGDRSQPTTRPAGMYDRQEQAMKDPFGYSANPGKTDISGGGLTEFDKDGFRKDLKNALDP